MALSSFLNIEDVAQPVPVSSRKSFSQSHAYLAGEWSTTRNCGWLPDDFSVASLVRAWWRCRRGHEDYRLPIASRVFGNKGCPACAALKKSAPVKEPQPGKKPEPAPKIVPATTGATARKVPFTTGGIKSHATINATTRKLRGKGKVSLAQSNPALSFEWHYVLNGSLTPDYISAGSNKRVWWQCRKNPKHVWQAGIATRSRGGKRCPDCAQASSGKVAS